MNLFGWLLLGHFVADWLLQSDWMAIGKRRHFCARAGLVHYLVYTLTILLVVQGWRDPHPLLIPSSPLVIKLHLLLVALLVFFSHWLIDGTNVVHLWMRLYKQRQQTIVYLVIDQTLHLVVLGVVAALLTQRCLLPAQPARLICTTKSQIAWFAQWLEGEAATNHHPPAQSE